MCNLYFFFFRLSQEKFSDAESNAIDWLELAKAVQQQAGEFFPSHILQSYLLVFYPLLLVSFVNLCLICWCLIAIPSGTAEYQLRGRPRDSFDKRSGNNWSEMFVDMSLNASLPDPEDKGLFYSIVVKKY